MRVVFGAFTLDLDRRELRHQDRVQPLEPKAFTVLAYLLTHRDRAIAKEELLAACWPGEFVTDAALARCVQVIRRAVADDGGQQQVIKTLRGYGYRFVATVSTLPAPAAALPQPGAPPYPPAPALSRRSPRPSRRGRWAEPPLPPPGLVRSVRRPIGPHGSSVPRVARRCGSHACTVGLATTRLNTSAGAAAALWPLPFLSPLTSVLLLPAPIPPPTSPAKSWPVSRASSANARSRRCWSPASRGRRPATRGKCPRRWTTC